MEHRLTFKKAAAHDLWWIVITTAFLNGKLDRFSPEETNMLVPKAEKRKYIINGNSTVPPKPFQVKRDMSR